MPIANTNRFNQPNGFQFWEPNPRGALPGYEGSPLYDWMAELNKKQYFSNFLGKQGLLGNDMNSDLARSLENKMMQGYEASQFENPDYKWQDHLKKYEGKMRDVALSIDPQSRGVNYRQYQGGARWLPRPK